MKSLAPETHRRWTAELTAGSNMLKTWPKALARLKALGEQE